MDESAIKITAAILPGNQGLYREVPTCIDRELKPQGGHDFSGLKLKGRRERDRGVRAGGL